MLLTGWRRLSHSRESSIRLIFTQHAAAGRISPLLGNSQGCCIAISGKEVVVVPIDQRVGCVAVDISKG